MRSIYKGYRSWDQYTKDTDHEISIQRLCILISWSVSFVYWSHDLYPLYIDLMICILCILISWSISFVYWSHDLYPLYIDLMICILCRIQIMRSVYKGYRSWDQYTKDTDHEINIQRIQIIRSIYKGYRSWD
jgi:hypothetical protein